MTNDPKSDSITVGGGAFQFQPLVGWEQLPAGWDFVEAVGVATDSQDRVYVLNRGEHPVIVFNQDGSFMRAWGEGEISRAHGITIGPDDAVYISDDWGHCVGKFTTDGKRLMTLGMRDQGSDTGVEMFSGRDPDYRSIKQVAGPFNGPTNAALAADGGLYVSDGYGNARVHRFGADGKLMFSWGEPGDGPGQFQVVHGIAVDRTGRVIVADRENSRLQFFAPDGQFVEQWTDVARPTNIFVDADDNLYVVEMGMRIGRYPWHGPDFSATGARLSIFDRAGKLLCRFGGGDRPGTPGDFAAAHDIWIDSHGSVYVAEVVLAAGISQGLLEPGCPSFQKLIRK